MVGEGEEEARIYVGEDAIHTFLKKKEYFHFFSKNGHFQLSGANFY